MSSNSSLLCFLIISRKELKFVNLFWIGFIIYTLAYTLATTTYVNYVVCQAFQIVGVLIFITTAVLLIHFKFENKYLKFIFILYCFSSLSVVVRGLAFNYEELKEMVFDAWFGVFIYFAPLILLFPKNLAFYKKLFDIILSLGIFYIIYDIFFIKNLLNSDLTNLTSQAIVEYFTKALSIPCGFLLLTYRYHSKRVNLLAIFVTVLAIFFALVRARRGLILISISPWIFVYILYLLQSKRKILLISVVLVCACLIIVFGLRMSESRLFNSVKERGVEDTRSSVEELFYKDMNTTDWIIGKGMNGKYFAPGIDTESSLYRNTIETDYLQIILKGGIVSLLLLLLITIPAVIKGLFYSKNLLSKASGIWILLWLISLYPANVTTFTLNYLLVWISVGICYSKTIRTMPENLMSHYFRSRIR